MRIRKRQEIVKEAHQGVVQNNDYRGVDDLRQVCTRVAVVRERHIDLSLLLKLIES